VSLVGASVAGSDGLQLLLGLTALPYDALSSVAWTDATAKTLAGKTKRGRNHELDRVEAGSSEARLLNLNREFDPQNTGSPYWPNLVPMRRLRWQYVYAGVTYVLGTYYIERWPPTWEQSGYSDVKVTASDALALLQLAEVDILGVPQELSGARINRLLDAAGWSAADRVIDTGQEPMRARDYASANVRSSLEEVAKSERGNLFVDALGRVVFHDRHHRIKPPYTVSNGTFGDQPGELPYTVIGADTSADEIRNNITGNREGGVKQAALDTTSRDTYGLRNYDLGLSEVTTDAQVFELCKFDLGSYKDPHVRVPGLELKPQASAAALWPVTLGRELGDRITVRPPQGRAGAPFALIPQHVDAIEHEFTPEVWTTKWATTPADPNTYWVLGDATNGVLGITTKLAV
jgi:hypothetical protein